MEEALRDLESAEDKVVRIMEIAAKVTGALADPNAAKAQEELARDAEEYVELVKVKKQRQQRTVDGRAAGFLLRIIRR